MTLWLIIAFAGGTLFGKWIHLAAEEHCSNLKQIHTTGYMSDPLTNVRCDLREEHPGPCRFRYTKHADVFPSTEWHVISEGEP